MSLLLDALKRSEQERQRNLKDRLAHAGPAPDVVRARLPWAAVIAALLLLNAALAVLWFGTRDTTDQARPAPAPVTAPPQAAIRSLAAEAALGRAVPDATKPAATPAAKPTDTPAPATANATPVAAASTPVFDTDNVPELDSLPEAFQQQLPRLHLDVLGYAATPSQRFAIINLERYAEGDTLPGGVHVVSIVPHGVILRANGRNFLLTAQH